MSYCCETMRDHATKTCGHHKHRHECPDCLIDQHRNGEFGIMIHDGGTSHVTIKFCPWCGTRLNPVVYVVIGYYDNSNPADEGEHTWTVAAFHDEETAENFCAVVTQDTKSYVRGERDRDAMIDDQFAPNWTDEENLDYWVDEVPIS